MNRLACIAVIGAALIAAPLPAAGAEDPGNFYRYYGSGGRSCGTWTMDRREDELLVGRVAEIWVLGFLTAANSYLPNDRGVTRDLAENTDINGLFAWIDNYCAAFPLDMLDTAVAVLVLELQGQWLIAHPPQ